MYIMYTYIKGTFFSELNYSLTVIIITFQYKIIVTGSQHSTAQALEIGEISKSYSEN